MTEKISLTVRMSPTEREELNAQASLFNMSCSDYAKRKIFGVNQEIDVDILHIRSIIIGLKHDIKDALSSNKISDSEFQEFLAVLDGLSDSVCVLIEELKKEEQRDFQKSVEEEHRSEKDLEKKEDSKVETANIFSNPFFDNKHF